MPLLFQSRYVTARVKNKHNKDPLSNPPVYLTCHLEIEVLSDSNIEMAWAEIQLS